MAAILAGDIFKYIFLDDKARIWNKTSLKFFPKCLTANDQALV